MVLTPQDSPNTRDDPREFPNNPFALIAECAQRLHKIWKGNAPPKNPDADVYLPSSIRTLLQTGDDADSQEILSVIHDARWVDAAVYLTLKALDAHPQEQIDLLKDMLRLMRSRAATAELQTRLEAAIANHTQPLSVKCGKLAQISRVGPAAWKNLFHKLNEGLLRENTTPCFIAYSSLTGLRAIVEDWPNDKPFLIALPKRIRTEAESSLFVVQCTNASCTLSPWHPNVKHLIPMVHLVDDTRKTGKTFDTLREDVHPHPELPDVAPKTYQIVVA